MEKELPIAESSWGPQTANALERRPLVKGERNAAWLTGHISGIVEQRPPFWWWIGALATGLLASLVPLSLAYQVMCGVGVWGVNSPVFWAWDITNFVFWIGIGHAGTLISAIFFLTSQKWRTAINRSAEAMTIFAVICASIFPCFHLGRVWMAWFMAPIPNSNEIWPNFKSPLLWDVFAVSTYLIVSLIFCYIGMIPDLAMLRDRATGKIRKFIYGLLAIGWRGGNRQWQHYGKAYLVFAGISTALVLSVHSVVSFDFATSVIPGWHTTIFPPYFVAGAIFGGCAMVLTLLIPARWIFNLQDIITTKHIDNLAKIVLLTGSFVGYAYFMELFIAWYSGNPFEQWVFFCNRINAPGFSEHPAPYWWAYWTMITCNVVMPQLFWFKAIRQKAGLVLLVVMFPNVGMWFERFVIIVTSLHRDYLPSAWGYFKPAPAEIALFVGTIGLFLFLFLLFIKWFPMITAHEVKATLPDAKPHSPSSGKVGDPPSEGVPL